VLFFSKHLFVDDGKVNTGAALWHVHENIFGSGLDRDSAPNCLVVITDENSDDDVAAPATELRKSGVLVRISCYSVKQRSIVISVMVLGNVLIKFR